MKRAFFVVILLGSMLPAVSAYAQDNTKFHDANTSYRTGDFEKAAKLYGELTREYPKTAIFYYDLGNAEVRLGNLSEAILAYEKAARLAPRDRDIRHNLAYTRGKLEYRVEDDRNWYLKAAEIVLNYFTQREVNLVVLVFLFFFLMSAIFFFMFKPAVFWSASRKFLMVLVLIVAAIAFGKYVQSHMIRGAIVMEKECEARYGPSEHDQVAFRMGEGIKVFIMDRREDWSRVLLTNRDSGWVKNSDIAEITV